MFELLDTVPAVRDPQRPSAPTHATPPTVRFEQVSLTYPGGSHPALEGFDLELPSGATIALVGRSGAGKSTCANLLLRFHDPQTGRVTLNGIDLRDVSRDDLRAGIALVSQDCVLFHGTVRDNLLLARGDGDDRTLWAALDVASAAEFVRALPDRLDTVVGERGVTLSGGERQRLAITRALLKDATVLVLDEATSSLDARNEAIVQRALDRLRLGRTTLIIAHRLSTVANADAVAVVEAGRIVELGTPVQLAEAGGRYAALQSAQLRAAERVAAAGRAT
jgi:ABC-type multidrug transport system fused ATPase/permease subunit